MVSSPGRDLDNLPLLQNLPGWRHQIYAVPDGLLDLQQFLELLNPLHGVIRVSRSLTDLLQRAWNNNSFFSLNTDL